MDLKKHMPIPRLMHTDILGDPTKNNYEKLSFMFDGDFFVLSDRTKPENPDLVFYDFKSTKGYYFHVSNLDRVEYVDTFRLCVDENQCLVFDFKTYSIWPKFNNYIDKCLKMANFPIDDKVKHTYLEHKIDYIESFINNKNNESHKNFDLCEEGFNFMATKLNQKMLSDLIINDPLLEAPSHRLKI